VCLVTGNLRQEPSVSRSPFRWWFVVPLFTLLMLPTAHLAAQSEGPPGRSTPNRTACQGCVAALYVTPTPSPVFEAPGSVNRTATFVVENQYAYDVEVWNPTCTRTGRVTSCGTISPTSLYLASGQYATITVRYNVSSTTGAGTLTLTVVHDGAGGATQRAGTLSVTVQATGAPTLALRNRPDQLERGLCLTTGAGPGALQCGDLLVAQGLPAYRTLGRDRALTLVYNSATAAPRPTVAALVTNPENSAPASSLYAELKVGATGGAQTLVASGTFAPFGGGQLTEARQIVLGFDAATYASGIYDYTLEVRNLYPNAPFTSRTLTGQLLVMNDRTSRFGRGWSLAGVERIFLWGPNMLWRGAGGTARIYVPVAGQSGTWVAPKAAFRDTLYWRAGLGLYERRLRHGVLVQYDPCGRQTATISRTQQTTSFTWAGAGCGDSLTAIAVPPAGTGGTYTIAYTNGVLDSISDSAGRVLKATVHPTSRQLTALRDPDNVTTLYGYDAADRLITHQGRTGYPTRYEYAGGLRVTKVITPYGAVTASDSAVTTIEPWDHKGLALGLAGAGLSGVDTTQVRTKLDGPRTDVQDTTAIFVDRWGAPSRTRDALGHTTEVLRRSDTFPALVTETRSPDGRIIQLKYDTTTGRGNLREVWDNGFSAADGTLATPIRTTVYTYGAVAPDAPASIADALNRVTQFVYNALGLPDSIIDPRGSRTVFTYEQAVGHPLRGEILSSTQRLVRTWSEVPGTSDDLDSTDVQRDLTTSITYDNKGNVTRVAGPTGVVSFALNDRAGRPHDVWDPLGMRTTQTYDELNRVTSVRRFTSADSLPLRLGVNMPCDATQIVCANVATPNPQGFPAAVRDSFVYNAVGLTKALGALEAPRQYGYDKRGLPLWERDGAGRDATSEYNAAGQVTKATGRRAGDQVLSFYDVLGRLIRTEMPATAEAVPGDTVSFSYDAMGRLLTATNRNGAIQRTYYRNGALRRQIVSGLAGGNVDTLQYAYNAAGQRTELVQSSLKNGTVRDTIRYSYNAAGELAGFVVAWRSPGRDSLRSVNFTWDELGRRRTVTSDFGGGVTLTYRYDAQGVLRRLLARHAVVLSPSDNLQFTYIVDSVDAVGRILAHRFVCQGSSTMQSPSNACAAGQSMSTRYYPLGTIANSRGTGAPTDSHVYDAAGNLTQRIRVAPNSKVTTYAIDAATNRVLSAQEQTTTLSTYTFVHDPNGARTGEWLGNQPDREYYYDAAGRTSGLFYTMSYVALESSPWVNGIPTIGMTGSRSSCQYNALGQVQRPCDPNSFVTGLVYDGENMVGMPNDGSLGRWRIAHGPGLDDPIVGRVDLSATQVTRELFWITDGRGRELAVALPSGWDPAQWNMDPAISSTNPDAGYAFQTKWAGWTYAGAAKRSFGFGGSRSSPSGAADAQGLSMYRNRFYDGRTGRWTQEDPIGIAGGVNLYQFNGNNPASYTDPFGLCPLPLATVCARAIVLAVTRIVPAVISAGNALADLHMPGVGGRHGGAPHRALVRALGEAIEEAGEGAAKITAGAGVLPERAVRVGGGRIRFPDITIEAADGSKAYINVGRTRADGTMVKREREAFDDLTGTGVPTFFVPYTR
jgi:RHS repeat-associated protein